MQYSEGHLLDNRYQLERFIGSGSYGEVWVANDNATDLEVAVKIYISMDDQGLSDFKKEFQITFDFNHTNLLHANYLGVNAQDRRPYLVMPFCPDGSVSKYAGQMSEEDLWRFIRDVSAGLSYLHSQQPPVIHQDIKPDNILILKNGDFVITDFGISRQLRASLRKSAMNVNAAAGSISYMGPERFSKQNQAVKASDIWSVGASVYELAVGDLPFCGMGGSLQKKGADLPELPEDDFSPLLNSVVQSCLAKEPWNRPTAAQLSEFADRVLRGESPIPSWGRKHTEQQQTMSSTIAQPVGNVQGTPQPLANKYPSQMVHSYPPVQPYSQDPVVSPVSSTPPTAPAPSTPDETSVRTIPAWVWIVVALAGLVIGFVINLIV